MTLISNGQVNDIGIECTNTIQECCVYIKFNMDINIIKFDKNFLLKIQMQLKIINVILLL